MQKIKDIIHNKIYQYVFVVFILMLVCIVTRFFHLGVVPGGVNQDEAYAGYEAYSLMNYGIDSSGYHNPVYFVSWGSGMNVLNSYLMIPFIKLFGLTTFAIRLPQAIIATISCFIFFLLLKKIFNKKTALVGLFVIAICPWHIMLARWGLESNLLPGLLLIGLYFFICGLDNRKFFIVSSIAYGLSLYCYAIVWSILPFIIIFQVIYGVYYKKISLSKELIISAVILFVFALPLLLFLLVNQGIIPEVKTNIISIPKLLAMRSNELSFHNFKEKFCIFCNTVIEQNDGNISNCTEDYLLFYNYSIPLIFLGVAIIIKSIFNSTKNHEFTLKLYVIIPFVFYCLIGVLTRININRINCIYFSLAIFITIAIVYIMEHISKEVSYAIILALCVSFISFQCYYYSDYKSLINAKFQDGLSEAIEYANDINSTDKTICVPKSIKHSVVLFYSKLPVTEYIDTVKYDSESPMAYRSASDFGNYHIGYDIASIDQDTIYVIFTTDADSFRQAGFTVEEIDSYSVAYH